MRNFLRYFAISAFISGIIINVSGQKPDSLIFKKGEGLVVDYFIIGGAKVEINEPLVSLMINDKLEETGYGNQQIFNDSTILLNLQKVSIELHVLGDFKWGWKGEIIITNTSTDTLKINNIVPFGASDDKVYITGLGTHYLSRTHLFRPGFIPVNVIVPDNAWELGFSELENEKGNICALSRRTGSSSKAIKRRFDNYLNPGESISYTIWAEAYSGDWQKGMEKIFRERMLYDIEPGTFNNHLYEREDLKWIRKAYVSHLIMAWDDAFYDKNKQEYTMDSFLQKGEKLYGGNDFIGIWPTWPTLGLDQRNQWDLYKDLPGGLDKLKDIAQNCRKAGTRFFVSYNPWDTDTRTENHYTGMARLIDAVGADGVVLDTQGSSSEQLQNAADSVRQGVIMYSEGMAVPKDMENIISGRVHNALYYPPMLNLNKFIKPDFAIFRVAEIKFEKIRREYLLSFFNGYGTEINLFPPGRPDWAEEDYRLLGQTSRILRENSTTFTSLDYTPLIETLKDSIWVNKWSYSDKTIYSIYSIIPEGFDDLLFDAPQIAGYHYIDLWRHEEIIPVEKNGKSFLPVFTEAFHKSLLGTNNEGAGTAIALLQEALQVELFQVNLLSFSASKGDEIKIWKGIPEYEKAPLLFGIDESSLNLNDQWPGYEGKIVVQLFENQELLDEQIINIQPATPRLVSISEKTKGASKPPEKMVFVPAGKFRMSVQQGDNFVLYPQYFTDDTLFFDSFFMDKFPVTNQDFKTFLEKSNYWPEDTTNFLKHWVNEEIPEGMENYPVVYISIADAKAYANWTGKRLPTEAEWQYAAQAGQTERLWPWDNMQVSEKDKETITNTLSVSKFNISDSLLCNTASNKLYSVGSYPDGANPFGLEDLTGCAWQITNDEYYDGAYYFIILKGGSYFNPGSSWWYVQGGPRPLNWRQMLLRVSPGFERNATVGFRCVMDSK